MPPMTSSICVFHLGIGLVTFSRQIVSDIYSGGRVFQGQKLCYWHSAYRPHELRLLHCLKTICRQTTNQGGKCDDAHATPRNPTQREPGFYVQPDAVCSPNHPQCLNKFAEIQVAWVERFQVIWVRS